MRNITLSLPSELVRRAKVLAAEQDSSVSALMRSALEAVVAREDDYGASWRALKATMRRGVDLGTGGDASWERSELHER